MDSEPQRTNDDVHSTAIKVLENQLAEVQIHLNAIAQYLRVNNVEIVGLPEPSDDETNEDVILSALNSLPELSFQLTSEHIDISHPIPSKRRDHKRVSICKFISRKAKIDVLEAKKKCRDFKYKGNDIYINEHLSPENRRLFATASLKRKQLHYKYLWTNNGVTYMRKDDGLEIQTIDNDEVLNNLE